MLTLESQTIQIAELTLGLHIATKVEQNMKLARCFVYMSPSLSTFDKLTEVISSSCIGDAHPNIHSRIQ